MSSHLALAFVGILSTGILAAAEDGILHLLYTAPVHVDGKVIDAGSNPLPRARIDNVAMVREHGVIGEISVHTNADGIFSFETLAPAVVIRAAGYKSQLIHVGVSGAQGIQVVMHSSNVEDTPKCDSKSRCLSAGGRFCLPKADGVHVTRAAGSIDASEREFIFQSGASRFVLTHGTGPSWGGPYPRGREVWSSTEFNERTRRTAHADVVDSWGKTRDGMVWRSVGVQGETAFYFDVDQEAGARFDKILDRVCVGRN